MVAMIYSVTVFIICAISCVYNAPADRKEKYTADFGEPYDFDEYDVVYDRKQDNPKVNVRTTGDHPKVLVLEPDDFKVKYVGHLPLPGREPCADFVASLVSLFNASEADLVSSRKVEVPYFCEDYLDMLADQERKSTAKKEEKQKFHKKMIALR